MNTRRNNTLDFPLYPLRGEKAVNFREHEKNLMHLVIEAQANVFTWKGHSAPDVGPEGGERYHAATGHMDAAGECSARLLPAPTYEDIKVMKPYPRAPDEVLLGLSLRQGVVVVA